MADGKKTPERRALELAYRKLRDLRGKPQTGAVKELAVTLAAIEALVPDLAREAR
jgi:hypothetical protein